ncbi:histidine kinase [Dictyobacter kobayashii]|uniref:histidine kinase n=2 Tax=Dictyobacter kobayashii TaxID=2014872 RepID=A0A402ATR8_9CHLR|nr:histidine kinase [Dictyobacter kobayashii]
MEQHEVSTISTVDVSQCDREPIQIPGSIQPHGVLLVLRGPELTIVQASQNTAVILGIPAESLVGQPLGILLKEQDLATLVTVPQEHIERNPLYLFTIELKGNEQRFDCIVHRQDGLLLFELEVIREGDYAVTSPKDIYSTVQAVFSRLQHSSTIVALSEQVAEQVRSITGFDRVMVYRFEPDGHGIVIAEARRADLPTFLNLHYPASDIPAQARRLYTLNWLRLIPDRSYTPVPLVPAINPVTGQTLDMSFSVLRSVSPIHIEYLKNMEVAASMSISIVKNNTLWGLIACHHETPHYISYDIRTACELIGRIMSLQVPPIEEREDAVYLTKLKNIQSQLLVILSEQGTSSFVDALVSKRQAVLDVVNATGSVIYLDGTCHVLGEAPPLNEIEQLVDWIEQQPEAEILFTNSLSQRYSPAASYMACASGMLALILSRARRQYWFWFRPEVVQTVQWAGEPAKSVVISEQSARLSPRTSFASWKQLVQGTALAWKQGEIEIALELRMALIHIFLRQAEELARLNLELQYSNAELDAFAYAASHDLKEPLRGIHNYAHFLLEDYGSQLDEEGVYKLRTLVSLSQRMEDLMNSLLYYSHVGRVDLSVRETDLSLVLQQALEFLHTRLQESNMQVRVPASLPKVVCDGARVCEIYINLISNAIKYSDKPDKWIEVGSVPASSPPDGQEERPPILYVRDNGIGISADHFDSIFRIFKRLHGREEFGGGSGVGLTIVKKIVERHNGVIWIESTEGQGTTFYWTLGPLKTVQN